MMDMPSKGRISDETFDAFLDGLNLLEQAQAFAIKEKIARDLRLALEERSMTKLEMARRMQTDRRQLDRLIDPHNASVTLLTLVRAARVLGKKIEISLVEADAGSNRPLTPQPGNGSVRGIPSP